MKAWKTRLLYAFFPRRCIYCDRVIEPRRTSCEQCADSVPYMDGICCVHCGRTKALCRCRNHRRHFDRVVAAMRYESGAQAAILRLKSHHDADLIQTMAEEMVKALRAKCDATAPQVVTYIPMMKRDEHKRGYNQSERLANAVASVLEIPCAGLLEKVYDTQPQKRLPMNERSGNVLGAFDVTATVSGLSVLLVDDLITTGCTLNECAKMLKIYGAEQVTALTFAASVPSDKEEERENENSR